MPVGNDAAPELLPTPEQRDGDLSPHPRNTGQSKPHVRHGLPERRASMWAAVLPAAAATCTSTPTAMWTPACSSTTPTANIREKTLLECLPVPICSWPITTGSPSTRTCSAPAPCWRIPSFYGKWCIRPAPTPRIPQSPESVDHLCDKCDYLRRELETRGGAAVER